MKVTTHTICIELSRAEHAALISQSLRVKCEAFDSTKFAKHFVYDEKKLVFEIELSNAHFIKMRSALAVRLSELTYEDQIRAKMWFDFNKEIQNYKLDK